MSEKQQEQRRDSLMACLVFFSQHYGRAKSPAAMKAGLAYDEKGMGPELFCQAAENLGFRTSITKRKNLLDIPRMVLPALIILNNDQVCVLLSVEKDKATIFIPETRGEKEVTLADLEKDYAGFAIFIHPEPSFTKTETPAEDEGKHWFWSQVEKNRGIYAAAMIGAVFINLFALTGSLFIMNVYDRVIPNNAVETGWVLGLGALTIFVFDFIMRTMRSYLIDTAGRRMDVIAGRRIYDHVLNMKLAYRPKSSGVFANMLRDFDAVREFFTSATVTVLVDLPFTIFFLFIIYSLAGSIAFILLALILIVCAAGLLIQGKLKSDVKKSIKTSEAKHGVLVETIHGLETLKAINADGRFRARYTSLIAENAEYSQHSRFWSGLGVNIATFFQQTASIIVVLAGMYMVQSGALSMGGLIASVILGGRALAPIGQVAGLLVKYYQSSGALKTLDKIMAQPAERPAHAQFLHRPDLSGKITFENISFSYPHVRQQVLDRVSFKINPGEKVGIVGRIGSGKSTIAKLIMNLYEPADGTILMDDTDYRQIDPADLRRNVAYISQDVFLFTGSIRENIAASVPGATEEQILAAAKAAGVHDFVSRHPMGYDAPVGENGEGLSGGQRQAVALARAMLCKPSILLCDEPTNAMDMQAEIAFKNYIEKEIKDKTFILITHKTFMLPMVDRLILMDQGRIVMDASRDEVLRALHGGIGGTV